MPESIEIANLLILGCSQRKLAVQPGNTIEAGSLYDGVAFRVLKAWQRCHPNFPTLTVLILSAKYGLVSYNTLLAHYNLKMTDRIAECLLPQVRNRLESILTPPNDVYVDLGQIYLQALPDLNELWPGANVSFGKGRIGERLRDLRKWLDLISLRYCETLEASGSHVE